ncbi:5-carboxymethyl-2-hydroxymuconate Delta-isomerase [Kitasatospora sp. NPDC056446]|uniref:5-carboxymethyl-2-hydroxymuconate Delta-isomerase n=1 Tax=Kitasatospora sp. NPDC056446 TaxID=3345819 RepID=UPI0036882C82
MPQILVDHSAELDFDRAGLADELHRAVTEVIDTTVAECKTLFRPAAGHRVGDGTTGESVVLVEVKILAGRTAEQRAALTDRVLAVLRSRIGRPAALGVQVTELDRDTYRFVHHPGH